MSFWSDLRTAKRIVGAIVAAYTGNWQVAATLLAVEASSQQARSARNKARSQYEASLKDRYQMVKGATESRKLVYGRARVSGPIVFAHSSGDKQQYLHLVIALAGHECDAIETIYFNDVALPTEDAAGLVQSGEYAAITGETPGTVSRTGPGTVTIPANATVKSVGVPTTTTNEAGQPVDAFVTSAYTVSGTTVTITSPAPGEVVTVAYTTPAQSPLVRVRKYLGTASQAADADLIAESGGKWTAAHKLSGICYLYLRLEFNQDVFGQVGLPNVSAVVRGRKVYDPRTATTAWSANSALCLADYLQDSTYGLGASAAQVPASEVATAAAICDQLVTIDAAGTTEARYTTHGVIDSGAARLQNLDLLTEPMAGTLVWVQGRWRMLAGAYLTPSLTITEDTLADQGPSIQPGMPRQQLINRIVPTYVEPAKLYTSMQAPAVTSSAYVTQDGGLDIPQEVTLDLVTGALRAQRLATIQLSRHRLALTAKLRCNLRAYDVAPGDVVQLTLARYGWVAKPFEVLSRTLDVTAMQIELTLRETAATAFDWGYAGAQPVTLTATTTLPNPFAAPAALVGLAIDASPSQRAVNSDGVAVPFARVSWTASADVYVLQGGKIELEWAQYVTNTVAEKWTAAPPASGTDTAATIGPLVDGMYVSVRVRQRTALGKDGPWAYVGAVVSSVPRTVSTAIALIGPAISTTGLLDSQLSSLAAAVTQLTLKASAVDGVLRDAGVAVDPVSGVVKISAIEQTASSLSDVQLTLNAQQSQINAKASVAYVDGQIAAAVLGGATPVFTALDTRLTAAELNISGLQSSILLKADSTTVNAQGARLTTAETNISGLTGTVATKADSATVTDLTARVTSAETSLSALGDQAAAVRDLRAGAYVLDAADSLAAQTTLAGLLGAWQAAQDAQTAIAATHDEVTAKIVSDVSAEASARQLLAASTSAGIAAVQTQATATSDAVAGLSSQYTLKVQTTRPDGKVVLGSIGVASTANNVGSQSQIILAADQLVFVPSSSPTDTPKPLLTAGLVGGVPTLVLSGDMVADGALTVGKLSIDGAKAAASSGRSNVSLPASPTATAGPTNLLLCRHTSTGQATMAVATAGLTLYLNTSAAVTVTAGYTVQAIKTGTGETVETWGEVVTQTLSGGTLYTATGSSLYVYSLNLPRWHWIYTGNYWRGAGVRTPGTTGLPLFGQTIANFLGAGEWSLYMRLSITASSAAIAYAQIDTLGAAIEIPGSLASSSPALFA